MYKLHVAYSYNYIQHIVYRSLISKLEWRREKSVWPVAATDFHEKGCALKGGMPSLNGGLCRHTKFSVHTPQQVLDLLKHLYAVNNKLILITHVLTNANVFPGPGAERHGKRYSSVWLIKEPIYINRSISEGCSALTLMFCISGYYHFRELQHWLQHDNICFPKFPIMHGWGGRGRGHLKWRGHAELPCAGEGTVDWLALIFITELHQGGSAPVTEPLPTGI